jgi:hypothetical protein
MAHGIWIIAIAGASALLSGCGSRAQAANSSNMPDAALADQPWPAFYQRAGELFQQGERDQAVTLFYIGQLRGRIIVQCKRVRPDGEPAVLASLNATVGKTINEYAGGSPEGWAASIDQALAWDEAHPDPSAADGGCRAERTRQRAGLAQLVEHVRANAGEIASQRRAAGLPNR